MGGVENNIAHVQKFNNTATVKSPHGILLEDIIHLYDSHGTLFHWMSK